MLTNTDITELVAFRRRLHRWPEPSGVEEWTAAENTNALDRLHPDELMTGLGGHGVAPVFAGAESLGRPSCSGPSSMPYP